MGLDVYLYKCNNVAQAEADIAAYNAFDEEHAIDFNTATQEEKDAYFDLMEEFAKTVNCSKYGESLLHEMIEINSSLYPDHLFKVGYFRSSYNDGGINAILDSNGVMDLYGIFDVQDERTIYPNWEESLKRAEKALEDFKAAGSYTVSREFSNGSGIKTREEAMSVFKKKLSEKTDSNFRSFSCSDGLFVLDGFKVYAIIGSNPSFIVHDLEKDWYVQALEIVIETIKYVLSQPDRDSYYFHWSA